MNPLNTDPALDSTALVSAAHAHQLVMTADSLRARREQGNRKRFARLLKDPQAIEVTIVLTDEVMRISSVREAARIFKRAAKSASIKGFGPLNSFGLHFLGIFSNTIPAIVVKVVHQRVRALSKDLILPAEKIGLAKHLKQRKSEGIRLNINVLGEAVLGKAEADHRFEKILGMISRPDVDYISVKLSAVVAQLITIDHAGSLDKVCEKLRIVYAVADQEQAFINLDMEEFRDLNLTVDAFQRVLSEPEFLHINAGIVLQAYLPESHAAFADLVAWAVERYKSKAGQIKIRLVKGANLAMEKTEAELNGWIPAPYSSKSDVDASYSRLLDTALRPEHAHAVRIGVASHNLFHLTWALEIARSRGVLDQIDIEMLEGMAMAEAHAVTKSGHQVLLYAPVTGSDDFASAVAYLVRRLDENTSDENYLKAAFDIAKSPKAFEEQRIRFQNSVNERHTISTESRRHQQIKLDHADFQNESSGDPTENGFIANVTSEIQKVLSGRLRQIPLVINGEKILTADFEDGADPSANGKNWYKYSVASRRDIDSALTISAIGLAKWSARSAIERETILYKVAHIMEMQRAKTIAVMSRDAGKTVTESDPEVSEAIDFARYYATMGVDNDYSHPVGIVLVVPPWNFPYGIPAGGVCAALAAGNVVILKPAPETVATAYELAQQLWKGGVPKDVLQFLPTRDDGDGMHLITHSEVRALILTGGFETAQMFTEWKPDLNLLAETSGKNALLLSACADIDVAVKDLVQSAFGHAGQKCSAASLGIVVESIFKNPAFTRQLIDDVSTLNIGAGYKFSTSVGPVIRKPDGNLLRALTTLDEGESWLIEPKQRDEAGLLWRPGIKIGIQPGSWSHRNEWFGPVLGIMVAPDLKTAIKWQNATPFGLTAGIHSLDAEECAYWMDQVEAGNLYINRGITGAIVSRQPFGGWKQSSVGATAKAGGPNYVNSLRNWDPITDLGSAKWSAAEWWKRVGSQAIDAAGLQAEKNYQRYRKPLTPIIVRVDSSTSPTETALIHYIAEITGTAVSWSTAVTESMTELIARAEGKVRWLSSESAPTFELLVRGVSLDDRPVAGRGDVEAPRWLLEQSVAITYHRYGNLNGGPKPECKGLGDY